MARQSSSAVGIGQFCYRIKIIERIPSKNHLARNIQILQVFFLQDLQDLAQNLARCALKMKLFLQDIKSLQESHKKIMQDIFLARFLSNLARKLSYNFFLQDSCKIFVSCKKSFIFSARLARYVQDLVLDLASLARKILTRFAYFLQDGFYWVKSNSKLKC